MRLILSTAFIFLVFSCLKAQDIPLVTMTYQGTFSQWLDTLEKVTGVDFILANKLEDTKSIPGVYQSVPLDAVLNDLVAATYLTVIPYSDRQWIVGYSYTLSPLLSYITDGKPAQVRVMEEIPEDAQRLEEVVITDAGARKNLDNPVMGLNTLSPLEIKELPRLMGSADIVKAIMTLPGISNTGEGSTGFYVRGGNVDQNLVLLDGSLIMNVSHVLGFFSVFNPDIVGKLNLYKGQLPARFGGRLSSVLEIETKDPAFQQPKMQGGVGLVLSQLMLETPLIKDKTAILISGRYAYPDWFLKQSRNNDIRQSKASFYDLNFKISQRVFNQGVLTVGAYRTYDTFQFGESFGYNWNIANYYLKWNQPLGKDFMLYLRASRSINSSEYYEPIDFFGYRLSTGLQQDNIKLYGLSTKWLDWTIQFGAEANAFQMEPQRLTGFNQTSVTIPYEVEQSGSREGALFAEATWDDGNRLAVAAGLRFAGFQQTGPVRTYIYEPGKPLETTYITDSVFYLNNEVISAYSGWEPRLSLRYNLGSRQSIKASFNHGYQYIHLLSNSVSQTPVDIWQVSTPYIKPQSSDNYSVGYFLNFRGNVFETSMELYYRKLYNLVDYKDFPALLLNPHIETELISGIGKAYGMEFSLRRNRGKLSGSLSYTYSRTFIRSDSDLPEETVNDGQFYPTFFDQPHSLKCYLSYKLGKTHQVGLNFIHNSGRPISAPIGNYTNADNFIPHFSDRNAYRIPYYQRVDISYTFNRRILKKSGFKDSFTFSIYNLLGRKNAFSIFFKSSPEDKIHKAYRLSVLGTALPSLSYNFNF
jgi:hypothetical protein